MSTNVNEDRKRLKELINEASNLERELKKQEQEKRKFNNTESLTEFDEDAEFLRNSLKDIYEDLILIDFKFSNEHNIEEKLWQHVFYSHIEGLRQKLRKINKKEKENEHEATYLELCRYLDLGTGFYHTIVNGLKIRENIDLDRIGIGIVLPPLPETRQNSAGKSLQLNVFNAQYRNVELRSLSIGLAFGLLVPIMKNFYEAWDIEDQMSDKMRSILIECLTAVSLWCQYLGTSTETLSQSYLYAKSVEKENKIIFQMFLRNLKNFFRLLSEILNHPKISLLGVDNPELYKQSIIEDIEFLGVVPLRTLQQDIIFTSKADPLKVRIARMALFGRKMAELKSLDVFTYNESMGQFTLIDEETKKKERQKLMKLMAQQLLQDQVNSLETNLQKRGLPLQRKNTTSKNTVVFDIGVILNHLNSVRKWVADGKCYVIVPLDVIDSLDLIKKGSTQENARAREAIRYLDQQFQKRQQNPGDYFIRAQKVDEKLPQWALAEKYLIGENYQDNFDECNGQENEDEDMNPMEKFSVDDIPQEYRPTLSCWLYYFRLSDIGETFFVTEDKILIKYAKMFGLPIVE
ncbi:16337_t:CDS:10, partial [Acaulospora colombiana]